MIIYEVNLQITTEIFPTYLEWLEPHTQSMLQFPGFLGVNILKERDVDTPQHTHLTVQYQIETMAHLDHYLQHHAQSMRAEAQQFAGLFSASRRIFTMSCFDFVRLSYTK